MENECKENEPGNEVSVKMSIFYWHLLLKEFDSALAIANRDHSKLVGLYETIATQLNHQPVKVVHRDNPDPEFRPKVYVPAPVKVPKQEPKPGWLTRTKHFLVGGGHPDDHHPDNF
jgi:hypothetical protein